MTEETTKGEEGAHARSIADELRELGQQLSAALKAAWESEERLELQREISEGLLALGEQIEEVARRARESEALQEAETDVKEAVAKAKRSDVVQNLRQGLVDGLQSINRELARLTSAQKDEAGGTPEGEDDGPAGVS